MTEANVLNAYLSCKFPNLDSSQDYSSGSLIRDDERVYEEMILCKICFCKKSIEFSFTSEITGPAQNLPERQSKLLPSER